MSEENTYQRINKVEQEAYQEVAIEEFEKMLFSKTKTTRGNYLTFHIGEFLDEKTDLSADAFTMFMQARGAKFPPGMMTWTDPPGKIQSWKIGYVTNKLSEMKKQRMEQNP